MPSTTASDGSWPSSERRRRSRFGASKSDRVRRLKLTLGRAHRSSTKTDDDVKLTSCEWCSVLLEKPTAKSSSPLCLSLTAKPLRISWQLANFDGRSVVGSSRSTSLFAFLPFCQTLSLSPIERRHYCTHCADAGCVRSRMLEAAVITFFLIASQRHSVRGKERIRS